MQYVGEYIMYRNEQALQEVSSVYLSNSILDIIMHQSMHMILNFHIFLL